MRRAASLVLVLGSVLLSACAPTVDPLPSSEFAAVPIDNPRDLPPIPGSREGTAGPAGGTVFEPSSSPIDHAAAYHFSLEHCGLHSPVDVDGSFWNATGGTTSTGGALDLENDGEMINATTGVIVVIGDEMRFRTDSGSVVTFARHAGVKEFRHCL